MLDIAFIRENSEVVKKSAQSKGFDVDVEKLLELDKARRELIAQVEQKRQTKNQASKNSKPSETDIIQAKKLKTSLEELEKKLTKTETEYLGLMEKLPNVIPEDTPLGGEDKSHQERTWGDTSDKDFEVVDHQKWGESRGLIDFERGAKVAGSKFYFLKGQLALLQHALIQFALSSAVQAGFEPMIVPHMVSDRVAAGTGYLPRGEERQIYKLAQDNLNLIATSEMPITGYHADEIIDEKLLPLKYAGISPSYRVEAGAYGKHSHGLYRVHQFEKVELYIFCKPEQSEDWHQKLVELEEKICQDLEIPYRVVRIAAGDLGGPAYKKYDIEYWSSADKAYRELMSCSNVTDFQARRLNIRYRHGDNNLPLHTLNATAMATSRTLIAIIENHQQADGALKIPKVLSPFVPSNSL